MARINNEIDKISAYLTESKNLTTAVVEEFVVQDKEFQVFQLAEFLAKGDAGEVVHAFGTFVTGGNMVVGGVIFLIITRIYC